MRTSDELRVQLIQWFAEGYTVRRIRILLLDRLAEANEKANPDAGSVVPVVSEAELLHFAVQFGPDIDKARTQLNEFATQGGLATPEVRIYKLRQLAEEWEPQALVSVKAAGIYLKTLSELRDETQAAGIHRKDDPWRQLLMQVAQGPSQQPQLEETNETISEETLTEPPMQPI